MNSLKRKIIAIAISVTCTAWLVAPALVLGDTASDLQATIDSLMAQIATLQTQIDALNGTTPTGTTAYTGIPAGFTFEKNLSSGMSDPDVVYLKAVLDVEVPDHVSWSGSDYFASKTKAAVVSFQTKYSAEISAVAGYTISCSGFVGTGTRVKINELLGR